MTKSKEVSIIDTGHTSFFYKNYKKPAQLIKTIKKEKEKQFTVKKPGLVREAIKAKNADLVDLLIGLKKSLYIGDLIESFEKDNGKAILDFFLQCADFPPYTFYKIMVSRFVDANNQLCTKDGLPFQPIYFIALYADEKDLTKIIHKLKNYLYKFIRRPEHDTQNFIDFIEREGSRERLKLILDILAEHSSDILTYQFQLKLTDENEMELVESSIHRAAFHNSKDKLELMFKYLKPNDYEVFVRPSRAFCSPIFYLIYNNHMTLLTKLVKSFGDRASKYLMIRNDNNETFLNFSINEDTQSLEAVKWALQLLGKENSQALLLGKKGIHKEMILETATRLCKQNILEELIELYRTYECWDVAHNYLISEDFTQDLEFNNRVDKDDMYDLLYQEYGVINSDSLKGCIIL